MIARATLVVLGLWGVANLVWLGRQLLFVAFFAILVAAFLSIFVDRLESLKVPRVLASIVVAISLAGLFAGIFVAAWPTLRTQLILIQEQLPQAIEEVTLWAETQWFAVIGEFGQPNAQLREQIETRLMEEATRFVAGALPLLQSVVGAVAGILIVLFAGLYLAVESRLYVDGVAQLIPPSSRAKVRGTMVAVGNTLRRWMLGTAINMVLVGALTTIGLLLLGVPAAFALGVIAGVFEFIPIFGPIIAAVPALAVALITSPEQALWVLLLYVGIQQIESNLITPLVMKGAVHLPPALTMVFQALMALTFGFLGLLLAVPILAAGMVTIDHLYVQELERREPEEKPRAA